MAADHPFAGEPGLILYRSNRIEALLDCLTAELRAVPPSPLAAECIVVQSRGMATWLNQRLADSFGVWANPDFPRPRHFIERILRAVLGPDEAAGLSLGRSRELLTLAIFDLLPDLLTREEFAPLHRYLYGADDWKTLQLAERIAYVFDQYAVYRPEMVMAWEDAADPARPAGEGVGAGPAGRPTGENRWQPLLWRQLSARLGSPVRPLRAAWERLRAGTAAAPELLPGRIFLFAFTTLPPLYLSLLNQAARLVPSHLLLFSPARGYWADIYSPQAVNRLLLRYEREQVRPEDLHLAGGHPLLASLGTVGREFQDLLEEHAAYRQPPGGECFVSPPGTAESLLARLQADILELRQPAGETPAADCREEEDPAGAVEPQAAPAIVIHSCHSPLREVEILQDQVLALLDRGECRPRDIVVMVPDIETYAPLIEAVFSRPAGDRRQIPFRIADRRLSREAPLLDALLALFELARGRLPASQVLDFLAREPVRRGLNLGADQASRIAQWVSHCQIRWGIDEEHRRSHGQPPDRQNTWRFGLDRLILGYAMPGRDQRLFADLHPYDDIEGQDGQVAGILLGFCEAIFTLATEIKTPRLPAQWAELVQRTLAAFFAAEPQAGPGEDWQRQTLREALAALVRDSDQVRVERPLELPAFLRLLRGRLDEAGAAAGFLEGGLTFCTMLPMRTIPFAVVCLLGMNDGAYPRQENPAGFDLLAADPRPGDRSRRQDDRYLFLESLLAARRRLYISYVGRSIKDNSVLPPSVLVDELLDCLAAMTGQEDTAPDLSPEQGQLARRRYVVEHPLQPFSPRYFVDPAGPLFTYAEEYAPSLAAAIAAQPRPAGPGEPVAEPAAVDLGTGPDLAELHRFFRNPAAWYARRRLGLVMPQPEEVPPDREPVFIAGLDKHRIAMKLLQNPGDLRAPGVERLLRARGELPLAGSAQPALAEIIAEVEPVAAFLATAPTGKALPPLSLDLDLGGGLRLGGELQDRAEFGLLRFTASRCPPHFFLNAWLDHLALCAQGPADQDRQCLMVGRGADGPAEIRIFRELEREEALVRLRELVELWLRGSREPLPPFRESSHAFVQKMLFGRAADLADREDQARQAALLAYHGGGYNRWPPPDGTDPYVQALFHPAEPEGDWYQKASVGPGGVTWEDFTAVACRVYEPLLQALEKAAL